MYQLDNPPLCINLIPAKQTQYILTTLHNKTHFTNPNMKHPSQVHDEFGCRKQEEELHWSIEEACQAKHLNLEIEDS